MRKKLQYFFLYAQIFSHKHNKEIILSFIFGILFSLVASKSYPLYLAFLGKKHQKIGVIGRFTENKLPLFIQEQISTGLTTLSEKRDALPALASNWETNDNETIYTFHLKDNLYWHDGKKFTAQDISYRLKDADLKVIDDQTLTVTLKDPFSVLPVLMSKPLLRDNFIGLGRYKITRTNYNGEILSLLTLSPLEDGLPTISYKFYSNLDEAMLAFKLGEVNQLKDISNLNDLNQWKGIKITSVDEYDRFVGIFFNLEDPLFKDKEIRQALAYAISPFNNFEKAYTPISPLSWAYSNKVRLYNYDQDTAMKILSKSPISSSSSQLTLSTYSPLIDSAETVAAAWSKVGINVKVKVESDFDPNFQIFIITQSIPPDPDQYHLWQSTQDSTNIGHYSNPKIDKLLEDGRKISDKDKRTKIYADFQRYLVDDLPVIFLYYPKVYKVERQ